MSINRKRDRYFVLHKPYVYVQALQGTTPWTAIGMVTVLQDRAKHNPQIRGLEMVLVFYLSCVRSL